MFGRAKRRQNENKHPASPGGQPFDIDKKHEGLPQRYRKDAKYFPFFFLSLFLKRIRHELTTKKLMLI